MISLEQELRRGMLFGQFLDSLSGDALTRRSGGLRPEPKVSALRAPATIANGSNDNESAN